MLLSHPHATALLRDAVMFDGAGPFCGVASGDLIELVARSGETVKGTYMTQAGMHFVHVTGAGMPLIGEVQGPYDPDDIMSVSLVQTGDAIKAERRRKSRGAAFPGRAPETREDFEYRLSGLARAVAQEADPKRKDQLLHQFDDVADRISLSAAKRAWIRAEASWYLNNNRPPDLEDLWFADVASPSLFARPRPQDFDPDPRVRRRRYGNATPKPQHGSSAVLKQLIASGFKARRIRVGDDPERRAVIQIDLDKGRTGRFLAEVRPGAQGHPVWELSWDGNFSASGMRNYYKWSARPAYRQIRTILKLTS